MKDYLVKHQTKHMALYLSACLAMMPLCAFSQKANDAKKGEEYKRSAVVKAFRTNMKVKNYSEAKKGIDKAIANHAEAASDPRLYIYKINALDELIKQENRKIYLKQNPDTVTYFKYIYELYETGLRCDSLEQNEIVQKKEEEKSSKSKLRMTVGNSLLAYRNNVVNAGKFYYKKKNYADAYRFFDLYIDTKGKYVFDAENGGVTTHDADDLTDISTLAVLSAYASSNYKGVMAHIDESLKDNSLKAQLIEVGYKTAVAMNDSTAMLTYLQRGFISNPEVDYFFMSLVRYYDNCKMYQLALETVDKMLTYYPDNRDYNYMRGKQLLMLARPDDAISAFSKCIEIEADDAESHSALGDIYLKKAQDAYADFNLPLSDPDYANRKQSVIALYDQSRSYYENAKKYDENNKSLWLEGLREAYFKLNKGRELRSLEKYK